MAEDTPPGDAEGPEDPFGEGVTPEPGSASGS